jgi:hypothetical protein
MSVLAHGLCLRLDLTKSLNVELNSSSVNVSPAVTPSDVGGSADGRDSFLLLLFPLVQG